MGIRRCLHRSSKGIRRRRERERERERDYTFGKVSALRACYIREQGLNVTGYWPGDHDFKHCNTLPTNNPIDPRSEIIAIGTCPEVFSTLGDIHKKALAKIGTPV